MVSSMQICSTSFSLRAASRAFSNDSNSASTFRWSAFSSEIASIFCRAGISFSPVGGCGNLTAGSTVLFLEAQLLEELPQHWPAIGIALGERLEEILGLLEGGMRRQGDHVGIGVDVEQDRPPRRQRLLEARHDVGRAGDADAGEAQQL